MTISANYNWTATSAQILSAALRKVGVTEPDASDLSIAKFALNALMKELQHRKDFPWLVSLVTFPCVVATKDYTLEADTADIEQVFVRENDYDYPVHIVSRFDENDITDKTDAGRPTACRFHRTLTASTLTLYPVPDDTYAVYYSKIRLVRNMDADANNADVLVEWINALIYKLAAELSNDYHLPLEERNWLEGKANSKMSEAKKTAEEPQDETTVRGSYVSPCYLILFFLLFCSQAFGAGSAGQVDFLSGGVMNASGSPISGGSAGFYEVGSVGNPAFYKATWQDANRAATSTNPIAIGVGGRVNAFADGRYDIEVKDSEGVILFQILGASYGVGAGDVASEIYTFPADVTDPTINITNSYTVGSGKMHVYLNGIRQFYVTELTSTSFSLTGNYLAGAELLIEILQ